MKIKNKAVLGRSALICTTLIWGTSFVVLKSALDSITPLWVLAIRFGGAALIFLLYICRKKRALQVAALWLWCLWQYALELGSWEMFAFAAAAAIPMLLYNGRRGPGLKWLFYGFYPAHLLILGLYACGIWPWAA